MGLKNGIGNFQQPPREMDKISRLHVTMTVFNILVGPEFNGKRLQLFSPFLKTIINDPMPAFRQTFHQWQGRIDVSVRRNVEKNNGFHLGAVHYFTNSGTRPTSDKNIFCSKGFPGLVSVKVISLSGLPS